MANTRIGRTVSSAGDKQKATFSAWIKRTGLSEAWLLSSGGTYSSGSTIKIGFNSSNGCFIVGPSSTPRMESTRKFRDTNAWYHYVVAFDTTQSTASNRLKFYINGELITDYGTETYPTLNQNLPMNQTGSDNNMWLGGRGESTYEFNGIMSHVHWCDGYVYDASAFGSTDATTGEWKIKTSPSVSYGTNGYFMLKDGNSLTDASGQGNNFSSLVGTLTKTEDNPSNVFATLNPLAILGTTNRNISNGNTKFYTGTTSWGNMLSTLAFSSGKFYAEFEFTALQSSNGYGGMGITDATESYSANDSLNNHSSTSAGLTGDYRSGQSNIKSAGSTVTSNIGNFSNGDIIGLAADMDNKALYIHKNGTYYQINSVTGVPTSGASKTGAVTIPATCVDCMFWIASYTSDATITANFGNGYFGTTAVSSAGTNASNNGIFEYDVPAGYTALSTKGLNL